MIRKFATAVLVLTGLISISGCVGADQSQTPETQMVNLIGEIRQYTQKKDPRFQILGNGATGLLEETPNNSVHNVEKLITSMDGFLTESVYYVHDGPDSVKSQSKDYITYLKAMFAKPKMAGKAVWTLDYIKDATLQEDDEKRGQADGYVSMALAGQNLDRIPDKKAPFSNTKDINRIQDAENFLFLLNPGSFLKKEDYLNALSRTRYDVLIVDLYYGDTPLMKNDVDLLKTKPQGGKRLVLAYMSIGEAADYRPYWKNEWNTTRPSWIQAPNPDWPGSFKVCYWSPQWKHILYGNNQAYLDQIIKAGFDGVFLDVIDAWQYFGNK